MIAASIIATNLGLPMYECSLGNLERLGGGRRMRQALREESQRIIVIEDSVNTGWSLQRSIGSPKNPRILGTATVYCTPTGIGSCDLYAVNLPLPHYFTWHMFGSNLLCKYPTGFDMDGILCQDCSREADDDGPLYEEFLRNVPPLYPYRGGVCGAIITARIEKYRSLTEDWLAKHKIKYKRLIMGPWSSKKERNGHDIGEWKGIEARKLGLQLFIESDPRQAPKIKQVADIPVMCPAAKQVFTP
jgi:orotate phosphoribosyltransferase